MVSASKAKPPFSSTRGDGPGSASVWAITAVHGRVGEGVEEHRVHGGRRESPALAVGSDRVPELDDALARRALEAAPTDEHRRVAGDEEPRAPARRARIGGELLPGAFERAREGVPARGDPRPQRAPERAVSGQCRVEQLRVRRDEPERAQRHSP